jgi:hypothetical protein
LCPHLVRPGFHPVRRVSRLRDVFPQLVLARSGFLNGLCELTREACDFIGESVGSLS